MNKELNDIFNYRYFIRRLEYVNKIIKKNGEARKILYFLNENYGKLKRFIIHKKARRLEFLLDMIGDFLEDAKELIEYSINIYKNNKFVMEGIIDEKPIKRLIQKEFEKIDEYHSLINIIVEDQQGNIKNIQLTCREDFYNEMIDKFLIQK